MNYVALSAEWKKGVLPVEMVFAFLISSLLALCYYTISFWIFSGLMKGDEIMVINGAIVSDLDMMFIESVLQEELTLCMMLRSSRPGKP